MRTKDTADSSKDKKFETFRQLQDLCPDYEYKLHLSLPAKVFHILKSDESCFDIPCKYDSRVSATLINRIILNMDSQPNTNFYNKNSELYDENPQSTESYIIDRSDSSIKFYHKLSWGAKDGTAKPNGTIGKLCDVSKKIVDIYKGSAGHYLNDLLETYTNLPYYKREEIFYLDKIQLIKDIKNSSGEYIMDVRYRGERFRVHPFEVMPDEWSSYNYCICYETENHDRIHPFRISYMSINRAKATAKEIPVISDKFIWDIIQKRGIQFCVGSDSEKPIEVLMTEEGKDMYDHLIFMRPQYISIVKMSPNANSFFSYKYTFSCTPFQAKVYFQKFGKCVKIESPSELAEDFKKFFSGAAEIY